MKEVKCINAKGMSTFRKGYVYNCDSSFANSYSRIKNDYGERVWVRTDRFKLCNQKAFITEDNNYEIY